MFNLKGLSLLTVIMLMAAWGEASAHQDKNCLSCHLPSEISSVVKEAEESLITGSPCPGLVRISGGVNDIQKLFLSLEKKIFEKEGRAGGPLTTESARLAAEMRDMIKRADADADLFIFRMENLQGQIQENLAAPLRKMEKRRNAIIVISLVSISLAIMSIAFRRSYRTRRNKRAAL